MILMCRRYSRSFEGFIATGGQVCAGLQRVGVLPGEIGESGPFGWTSSRSAGQQERKAQGGSCSAYV